MKRLRPVAIASAVSAVVLFVISGCALFPTAIAGHSFPESVSLELAEEIDVYTILEIQPAINGRSVFVTDENGFLEISDVSPGTYVVTPAYFDSSWSVSVEVKRGRTARFEAPYPDVVIELLEFRTTITSPPFDSATNRRAFSAAIQRAALGATLERTGTRILFPGGLDLSSFQGDTTLDQAPDNDLSSADADTAAVSPFSFELLINDSTNALDMATAVQPYLESLAVVTGLTQISLPFGDYLDRRVAGNFELSRLGWAFDSNNLARYLELWRSGGLTGYFNSSFDAELNSAHTAIEAGDLAAYETAVATAHNMLIADMPVIPLYTH